MGTSSTLTSNDSIVTNTNASSNKNEISSSTQSSNNSIVTNTNASSIMTESTKIIFCAPTTNTTITTTSTAPAIDNDSRSDSEGDGFFNPIKNKPRWTLDDYKPSYNAEAIGLGVHNRNEYSESDSKNIEKANKRAKNQKHRKYKTKKQV